MLLTRFEQKNGHLAQVEVDEVFGFMCHITTEVPPHDAVPAPPPSPCSHLLNMGRNVLLYVIFLQRLSRTLHRVLLHLLRHIGVFDHRLSVAHGYLGGEARWGACPYPAGQLRLL
uniref:Dynein light chain n=1 Tax=Canis lupus familiaris TaxID=9615 RepID=A0A8C0TCQ6_CANLF